MYSGELDLNDFRQLRTQYNSSALAIGTSALRKVGGMSPGPAASFAYGCAEFVDSEE